MIFEGVVLVLQPAARTCAEVSDVVAHDTGAGTYLLDDIHVALLRNKRFLQVYCRKM